MLKFGFQIPSASTVLLGSPIDWQYPTVSNNDSCLSSKGRACRFSSGKCLGGSTSINYMLYTRGNRQDFEYDVPGWTWEDLMPYFLRYEGVKDLDKLPRSSRPYHNTSGIVKVGLFDDPQNPWHSRIYRGYRELNFPANRDVNGVSQIGVTLTYGYVQEGERMSTARAYLASDNVKSRLHVATHTLCTGVIIDENNTARGITVLLDGSDELLKLFAVKEVILSAGTIGSSQIMMLSGIGHADHLREMNIPVRADLPVGDNLSDHVLPMIVALVDGGVQVTKVLKNFVEKAAHIMKYFLARNGPLASNGLTDINAFANTRCYDRRRRRLRNNSAACELPNVQVIHAYIDRSIIPVARAVMQRATALDDSIIDQLAAANINHSFMILSPILLTPHSRGSIRLASKDPRKPPAIFPNFLSDKRDVDELLRFVEMIRHLLDTRPFREQNATMLKLHFPGCKQYRRGREAAYWRCYVRHMTYSVFHAVGTCSLGAVVDEELRVKGVRRLRVADLSVLPRPPRGNTEAIAIAVGERVVDFIKRSRRS